MYYNTTYKPKPTIINLIAWRASCQKQNGFHKERSVRTYSIFYGNKFIFISLH